MCLPAAYAAFAVLNAAGAASDAAQNRRTYSAQARMAEQQAKQLGYQADEAISTGAQQLAGFGQKVADQRGQLRVGLAASGVELSSGSPAQIQSDLTKFSREDMARIEHQATLSAWGYRSQAQQALGQAAQLRKAVKASRPLVSAGVSLLGSALQAKIDGVWKPLGGPPGGSVQDAVNAGRVPLGTDPSLLQEYPFLRALGGR